MMETTTVTRTRYRPMSSRITMGGHLFGILALICMLIWLLHYRGGIELDSDNNDRVFNVHPFLMFFGFIFLAGEAIMAYRTVTAQRRVQKFFHAVIHLIAMIMGIVGIYAVFKYHDMVGLVDMYSLHSWIGLGTFCLFGLQWLLGLFTFLVSRSSYTRDRMLPWHIFGGRALLYMAVIAAETGLMEKATIMRLQHGHESRFMNFTGLFILLFGVCVDLSLSIGY